MEGEYRFLDREYVSFKSSVLKLNYLHIWSASFCMQFGPKSDVVVSGGVLLSPVQNVPQWGQDHIRTGLRFLSAKQKKNNKICAPFEGSWQQMATAITIYKHMECEWLWSVTIS